MVREQPSDVQNAWFSDEGQFRELSQRAELLAALLANAHDGLSIADAHGRCILINRALCQMTGFSPAELLTAAPYPYWPDEELDRIRSLLASANQTDPPAAALSFQRKNGERFPVLLRPTVIRDQSGQRLVSMNTVIDLSATRQATAALMASEQRWRSIVENPFDYVAIIGRDYKYRFINQVFPGIRFEDMVGVRSPLDFIAPEDQARVREHFEETFRSGRSTYYEVHVPVFDRWFSNVVGAIKSDGEISELSVLSRDITQSKRSERAQRRSERRLALALASIQDGLVELDLCTGAHTYSARTYELLGYADGDPELSTQVDGLLSRVHPEELARVEGELRAAASSSVALNLEFRIRARDGSYRWIHVRGRTVEEDEEKRFVMFLTDITQRYEAEEQRRALAVELQQAQRLETIGTLAGGIAHDFNNLLTPIVGALELAQLALSSDHSAQSVIDDARGAAHRAKCLTQQILTFARRGQRRLDPVDLAQLVREELRLQPMAAGVQLETDFPRDVPMVLGDRAQLQQIIANLLANALHAMHGRSGQLLLRVDRDPSDDTQAESHDFVRLTVSDQGIGMPESVQSRVFEPFFTTKPLGQGTGLGLAVVHGVVTRHGGHLRLHSEPDKGTTVEVYLPIATNLRPSDAVPAPFHGGQSGHIVCVDDEAAVLGLMKRTLDMASYSVRATTSPHQAMEWIRAAAPRVDVLVTDYRMPELSGLDLAQRARALRPDLGVILVTGHAEGLPPSGNPSGIDAVIQKPFQLSELIQCVQGCLASRSAALEHTVNW